MNRLRNVFFCPINCFIFLFIRGGTTKFWIMFIKVSLKIATCMSTSLKRSALSQSNRSILSWWDQNSLCCSTILFFHSVEDNRWIHQTKWIPNDDDNLGEESVEHQTPWQGLVGRWILGQYKMRMNQGNGLVH